MVSMYRSALYRFVILLFVAISSSEPISSLDLVQQKQESGMAVSVSVTVAMAMKSKVVKKRGTEASGSENEEKLESASVSASDEIYPWWPINSPEWSKSKSKKSENGNSGESSLVNSSEEKSSPLLRGKVSNFSFPHSIVDVRYVKISRSKFQRQSKTWKFGKGVQSYIKPISHLRCKFHEHVNWTGSGQEQRLRPIEYLLSIRNSNRNNSAAAKTVCRDLNLTIAEFESTPSSQKNRTFIAIITRNPSNEAEEDLRLICESSTLIEEGILRSRAKLLHCSLFGVADKADLKNTKEIHVNATQNPDSVPNAEETLRINSWDHQNDFLIANLSWPWPRSRNQPHQYFHLSWEKVGSGITGNLVTDENTATITLVGQPGVYSIQVIALDVNQNLTENGSPSAVNFLELLAPDKPGRLIGSVIVNTSQAYAESTSQKITPKNTIANSRRFQKAEPDSLNSTSNNFTIVAETKIQRMSAAAENSSESETSVENLKQDDQSDRLIVIAVTCAMSGILIGTLIFAIWLFIAKKLWARSGEIKRNRF